jgi:hypothetical protein
MHTGVTSSQMVRSSSENDTGRLRARDRERQAARCRRRHGVGCRDRGGDDPLHPLLLRCVHHSGAGMAGRMRCRSGSARRLPSAACAATTRPLSMTATCPA